MNGYHCKCIFPGEASAESSYVLCIETKAKEGPPQSQHVTGNSVSEAICALKRQTMKDALSVHAALAALFSGEISSKARKHSEKQSLLELKGIKMCAIWKSSFRYIYPQVS